MPSRSSSGTSMPNSSSSAMTSSTRSTLSASRSSPNFASGTTLSASTDSTSTAQVRKRANSSSFTGSPCEVGPGRRVPSSVRSVSHAEATVDRYDGAGDVRGLGGGEEDDRRRDLVDRSQAAERHGRGELGE